MARSPIYKLGDTIIASVQDGLRDRDAVELQMDLGRALERTGAQSVVIDISVVETVDSFLGRTVNEIANQCQLLGADTVVVGMQPAVAVVLVEMGLGLKGVQTALDVEKGLKLLARTRLERRQDGNGRGR